MGNTDPHLRQQTSALVNEGIRRITSQLLPKVFADLCLPASVQLVLLGLPCEAHDELAAFHRGEWVLPNRKAILDMASDVMRISQDLILLSPSPDDRRQWATRPNDLLGGLSPVEVMSEGGAAGVRTIALRVHRAKRAREFELPRASHSPLPARTAESHAGGVEL